MKNDLANALVQLDVELNGSNLVHVCYENLNLPNKSKKLSAPPGLF